MKSKKVYHTIFLFSLFMCLLGIKLLAQDPPSPPGGHGRGGSQGNSGAPIDGGAGILLTIGTAYGIRKLYQVYQKTNQRAEDPTREK